MKRLIQLEELAMLGISIYALYFLKAGWWIYPLLLLGPDISMLGYVTGSKPGAVCYNFFHHKATAIVVFFAGFVNQVYSLEIIGLILFGHSSMDRMLGYGLKYFKGFQFTHLGQIGHAKSNSNTEIK
jgi:hypothetical protein